MVSRLPTHDPTDKLPQQTQLRKVPRGEKDHINTPLQSMQYPEPRALATTPQSPLALWALAI